jgi:hypothetical protein
MRFYYFLRNLHLEHINTLYGKQMQLSVLQCAHIGQNNKSATIEHTYTKKSLFDNHRTDFPIIDTDIYNAK